MGQFAVRRIYDEPVAGHFRILVDRLWPRGVSKERAAVDVWLKDVAPSPELRTAFDHQAERFDDFRAAYLAELAGNPAVAQLRDYAHDHGTVDLLYAARDTVHNHAVVLSAHLNA